MSRLPDDERPNTSQRLIRLRREAGFTNAKAFLADVKRTQGRAPSYSTYAQWESGEVTPRAATIEPIWCYHAAREAESMPAMPAPMDPLVRIALALESIAGKLDLLRADMAGQSGAVIGEVRTLAEQLTGSLAGMRDAR